MIGLDTNILVMFFTHDDAYQTPLARAVGNSLTAESPGDVSLLVIAELVWVLESCYRFTQAEIVSSLETLLRSSELTIQDPELAWQALRNFQSSRADCRLSD
jgi:predicted nucleic-acid-binding protein